MKKLLTFAGVLALAIAFAVDGTAAPGGNRGPPGGGGPGGGGGPTSTVSQFNSRLVDVSCAVTVARNCEVAGSMGEIDGQGIWKVITSDLSPGDYAICLDAVSAPESMLPFFLAPLDLTEFQNSGTIGANTGDWVGVSFQIWDGSTSGCTGNVVQESGLSLRSELLDGEEASMFTSPFVDLTCGSDNCEVTNSYFLINNNGDWVVLAYDLIRGIKYDICVDAVIAPESMLPFRLASRSAQRRGTFLASGNMVDRYMFDGHWVGLSFQIYVQDVTAPCAGEFVQEIGINIVPPP